MHIKNKLMVLNKESTVMNTFSLLLCLCRL